MQQSDKHGPIQDEALKHETQDLERAGRSTHVEEWADPEPSGEDQPAVATDPAGELVGGTPPGMTPREVAERSLIARYLGASVYPATRDELVARLREQHAPDRFISRVETLPRDAKFENVRDVAEGLGLHVETRRF